MKKIFLIFLLFISHNAIARLSWDEAQLVEDKLLGTAGGENIYQCTYQLLSGGTYRFSTRYKGFNCPYSIVVNIESGKWKERR